MVAKTLGFDYLVEYKKGSYNGALMPSPEEKRKRVASKMLEHYCVEPTWLNEVQKMVRNSKFFKKLKEQMAAGILPTPCYCEFKGIWFYKDRVSLNPETPIERPLFFLQCFVTRRGTLGFLSYFEANQAHILVARNEICYSMSDLELWHLLEK